jgi:hypothetical protein
MAPSPQRIAVKGHQIAIAASATRGILAQRPGTAVRTMRHLHAIAIGFVVAGSAPALAQQSTGLDLSVPAAGPPLAAPFTKPGTARPGAAPRPEAESCVPGLPCGTQLYGAARRRSVLELQVPAWRW